MLQIGHLVVVVRTKRCLLRRPGMSRRCHCWRIAGCGSDSSCWSRWDPVDHEIAVRVGLVAAVGGPRWVWVERWQGRADGPVPVLPHGGIVGALV